MDYEVRNNLLESENKLYKAELEARLDKIKELEEENRALGVLNDELRRANEKVREENKNLKLTLEQMENTCKDYLNDRDTLREENRKLKEEIGKLVMKS